MPRIKIAIIGFGAIARRHVAVISQGNEFELAAIASLGGVADPPDCPVFSCYRDMLSSVEGLDAVAICTPPGVRFDIARQVLAAGKHLLLEKPPTTTLGEIDVLRKLAVRRNLTLFTAWHSQFNTAVARAREILAASAPEKLGVTWHEDVEHWHPGQEWIWDPRGLGVFDAGINALSILTYILPSSAIATRSILSVTASRAAPIAASIEGIFSSGSGVFEADFDWRVKTDRREFRIQCIDGTFVTLAQSGRSLLVDGKSLVEEDNEEYHRLYCHFATLVKTGSSDIDVEPLRLAADAFLIAERKHV